MTTHTFSDLVNIATWNDGNYTTTLYAQDKAGNNRTVQSWFILDKSDAFADITSPANNSWQSSLSTVTYSTSVFNVKECKWRWRDEAGAWSSYTLITCGSGLTLSFNTTQCNDDSVADCEIELYVEKNSGSIATKKVAIRIDNTASSGSITQPTAWNTGSIAVNYSASDTESGISGCDYAYDPDGSGGSGFSSWQTLSGCTGSFSFNTTLCNDGTSKCKIRMRFANGAGLYSAIVGEGDAYFHVDNSIPIITYVTLNDTVVKEGTTITVTSNGRDTEGIINCFAYFDTDTTVAGATQLDNLGTTCNGTVTLPTSIADGTYYVIVRPRNNANLITSTATSIDVDDTPASIVLNSPSNTSQLKFGTAIDLSITEPHLTVAKWSKDGGVSNSTTFVATYDIDTTGWSEGIVNVDVWVDDAADNSAYKRFQFTVDNTPPVISNAQPSGLLSIGNPTISVTTNEAATCKYSTTNVSYSSMTSTFVTTGGTSHSNQLSSLTDGTHTYYVRCSDAVGNTNPTSTIITFSVDTQGPVLSNSSVTPSSPVSYQIGRVYQFRVTATDSPSGVDKIILQFNGINYTASLNGGQYAINISDLAAGNYQYKWIANDTAGAVSNTSFLTYTINKALTAVTLLLNGTAADATYIESEIANFTVVANQAGTPVKLATNITGWQTLSGSSPLQNLTKLGIQLAKYNITGYVEESQNFSSSIATQYLTLGLELTFNITKKASPVSFFNDVKFFMLDRGGDYSNFRYQKKYDITTQNSPMLKYIFTEQDMREGRDLHLELPTDSGLMKVDVYNISANRSGTVPIRVMDGKDYTGHNPITGKLTYIFFIDDSIINYTSYKLNLPFNKSVITQPNKFLKCVQFNWTSNDCTRWDVKDTSQIAADSQDQFQIPNKIQSFKCSPAMQTGIRGDTFSTLYANPTGNFQAAFFNDFEFEPYGGWYGENSMVAYSEPGETYSSTGDMYQTTIMGSGPASKGGFALKAEYTGGGSTYTSTYSGFGGNNVPEMWMASSYFNSVIQARQDADTVFQTECNNRCNGLGTVSTYIDYFDEQDPSQLYWRTWKKANCMCGTSIGATSSGYIIKDVNFYSDSSSFLSFAYKIDNTSTYKMDMKALVSGPGLSGNQWITWNGTSSSGNSSIPGFLRDGKWHRATINLDKDIERITGLSGNYLITKIKFGHDQGVAGTRFYIDDIGVTNDVPQGAARSQYSNDFEDPEPRIS